MIFSGYDLWLGYAQLSEKLMERYNQLIQSSFVFGQSDTLNIIHNELVNAFKGFGLSCLPVQAAPNSWKDGTRNASLYVGTIDSLPPGLAVEVENDKIPTDGYYLKTCTKDSNSGSILITATTDTGLLYGTYGLLRLMQQELLSDRMEILDAPRIQFRMLDHWDNLDGTIERGYAGSSIWKWEELPETVDSRYRDYARACASIGLNATVLNNVNTTPEILTENYLKKIKVLADIFRIYGISVFLSVNFASPISIGGLETADPCNENVISWWRRKTEEIYNLIPDFGGYLVKADSEGQPGPYAYNRDHADGANMLAEALSPHNGILIWRAFVYGHGEKDRAKTAYSSFMPLDGKFLSNAVIQIKNGPIDFQPREPVHPLFGGFSATNHFMEFQVTQEYLGQGNHIVYLGPMWKEILDFDTHNGKENSTVGGILETIQLKNGITGIAAVANIGDDATWCGSHMHPLNWYAYGRLCWDHTLDPEKIAQEWLACTFRSNNHFMRTTLEMLMMSWETCIDYMTPLGLHHIMQEGHHYGPDPGYNTGHREDWRSTYYHRADKNGIGFDRTRAGSNAVDQYAPKIAEMFNNLDTCPEKYLCWFHHVPWDHRLSSGRTMSDELKFRYHTGVTNAEKMLNLWKSVENEIDTHRFEAVLEKLSIQVRDARKWENVCVPYFSSFVMQGSNDSPHNS